MKFQFYAVLQAEALNFVGFKANYLSDPSNISKGGVIFFSDKESAREYLLRLIKQIKHEQTLGLRSKDNLDPKLKLDFLITKAIVNISNAEMRARGWSTKQYLRRVKELIKIQNTK